MNRHSLIFNITLFFVFLMTVLNVLFYLQYRLETEQFNNELMKRFHESERILHMSRMDGFSHDEAQRRLYEIMKVEILDEEVNFSDTDIILEDRDTIMYKKNDAMYFQLNDPRRREVLHLKYAKYTQSNMPLIGFALLINVLVLFFYLYVVKRLIPLKTLKKDIIEFANGNTNIVSHTVGKDEIAEVSQEFNSMTEKLQTLQDSRKLFLRNIMHELKTPITKGKLITDLMNDEKNQERLKRIFSRFEYLLGEFTKIERVTSNAMTLNRKKYRVIDIIDNALDLLLLDETNGIDIETNYNLEIDADYELMSIALKNLIDNAMKYSKESAKIIIEQDRIIVQSSGDKLGNISFDKVFNRKYEGSEKGLGLGLYITKNIVSKHGYVLSYVYNKGTNNFIIYI
ncbi:ArsS family sensor histidine kinase [Sulfurovum sp.]|uniref:ArsS family sensor histidine kinase n=1 Tax=Sulfurovum sp. TaxID=1969726 RepID=UPI002867E54A|nr:ArsS family sensor histidine kinase [Sulfurovum sp.]